MTVQGLSDPAGRAPVKVLRYVERNALRANLVPRAEDWRWSSLAAQADESYPELHPGPVPRGRGWTQWVNTAETEADLKAVRHSIAQSSICLAALAKGGGPLAVFLS